MKESSGCSAPSPAFGGVSVPDFGPSRRCAVVSHCLNTHLSGDVCCGAPFPVFICYPCIFFREVSGKVLAFFFFFGLFTFERESTHE